jgi:hypothetical protein
VQRAWKKHHERMKKERMNEEIKLTKIINIQRMFRGMMTRRRLKQMMIDRLKQNNSYFSDMKVKVTIDSAIKIQRRWRSIIGNLRKFKHAHRIITQTKLRKLIFKWNKMAKKGK